MDYPSVSYFIIYDFEKMNKEQIQQLITKRQRHPLMDVDLFVSSNEDTLSLEYKEDQYIEASTEIMIELYMYYITEPDMLQALNGRTGISAH